MNARPMLTDRALEAMLERRAGRARVDGLPEVIVMAVSTEPVPRRPLLGRPGWLRSPALAGRPALVAALLVLAAAAMAVLAGAWLLLREPPPKFPLQPTGLQAMSSEWQPLAIAPDADGGFWVERAGGLARFDADGRLTGQWTAADDRALQLGSSLTTTASSGIARSARGGLWTWQGETVRRFDGRGFTALVEVGAPVSTIAEAPDGILWIATGDGRVLAWDGTTLAVRWSRAAEGAALRFPYTAKAWALAVSPTGDIWGTFGSKDGPTVVGRYERGAWRNFGREEGIVLRASSELALAPDGMPWLLNPDVSGADDELLRFDGAAWVAVTRPPDAARGLVIGAGDVPWVIAGDWSAPGIWWFDGAAWRQLDTEAGVTGGAAVLGLAPAGADILVTTDAGTARIRGGRFEPVWTASDADGFIGQTVMGGGAGPAWVVGRSGAVPYVNGAWGTAVAHPDGTFGMTVDAASRLWAWGEAGLAVREGNSWRFVDAARADSAYVGPDGDAWAFTQAAYDEAGVQTEQPALRHLVPSDGTWRVTDRVAVDVDPPALAVGASGRLFVAGGFTSSLAPFLQLRVDGEWADLPPLSDGSTPLLVNMVLGAAYAPSGELWLIAGSRIWGPPTSLHLAVLRDGTWTQYPCGADDGTGTSLPVCDNDGDAGWGPFRGFGRFAFGPGGSVWLAGNGLARFDGTTWTSVVEGVSLWGPVIADDGSVWAAGEGGIYRWAPGE